MKTIDSIVDKKIDGAIEHIRQTTTFVYIKRKGHRLGSNNDKLFLCTHLIIVAMAKGNLTRMVSTFIVALASSRYEKKYLRWLKIWSVPHVVFSPFQK